jgi:hypothetical protein
MKMTTSCGPVGDGGDGGIRRRFRRPTRLVGPALARIGDPIYEERQPRVPVHDLVVERPVEA